jgi:Fe-S-cluster-containing dehydrogenase component/CRP-like cAMP-binding protein
MAEDLISIKRPARWDVPFWQEISEGHAQEMTAADVDSLLGIPMFSRMDSSRFPESAPLRGILLNDSRLRRFHRGDIVVRQGDYGNSAFIVLSGSARVVLEKLDDALISRPEPHRKGIFEVLAQLWKNPRQPEVRNLSHAGHDEDLATLITRSPGTVFVQDVSAIIADKRTATLSEGEVFGEIAAMSRTPRTSTVLAETEIELLEIRWQGLREIRLHSPEFKEHIDRLYRERSLKTHLRETPMFRHLDEEALDQVADATEFQTFGHFEWYAAYSQLREVSMAERIQKEPLVAAEGHYANGIYLIRSGFARLSESYNNGERTVSYLGRGQTFGFEEAAHNWSSGEQIPLQRSLRALGYVDVLFVPTPVLEKFVLPKLSKADLPAAPVKKNPRNWSGKGTPAAKIGAEMMEFVVEQRFINGTATMIIDLDRCTRCDDCVRACATTHNNNPRFIRHGPVTNGYMITNACMHCLDPVCMIGCPTGAIHRDSAGGRVVINDNTCIGCATCANSCPYDNIQMVFARHKDGSPYYDEATNQPIQKAAKCDLCASQITGPACANACPHDALVRMNMRDLDQLAEWFAKR